MYKILILTDHTHHSSENAVYKIASTLSAHSLVGQLDIATRGNPDNDNFFKIKNSKKLWVSAVHENFSYTEDSIHYTKNIREVTCSEYDMIWLRLPPPLEKSFLYYLHDAFPQQFIINNPISIYETGSKSFLANFQEVCPPLKICHTLEDIIQFKEQFPIVLKPFRDYGGKGIVRIDGDTVWEGNTQKTFKEFSENIGSCNLEYLGVKFLKNVKEGDKRIIVVDGKVLGASLRLPSKDSWLCNVAMGGTSHLSDVAAEEYEIVRTINPTLSKMGIVMYGVDTLVGDDGKRVLSEINTTSIGGLPQIAQQRNLPLVEEAVALILNYFIKNKKNVKS